MLEIASEGEPTPLVAGVVADRVFEVTDIDEPGTHALPRIGMSWPADLIRGVALWKGDFVILPDLGAILH